MRVSEIFYSLQGEGMRAGEPSIFIRLSGCQTKHACYESGVICDTDFESGQDFNDKELMSRVEDYPCEWLVWTGGEPADQLNVKTVEYFGKSYKQAIECSGIKQPPEMEWVTLSPKVAEHTILKKWELRDGYHCDELRWVRHSGQSIPETNIKAREYFISPHFDGNEPNQDNINHCIRLCMENPPWKLSIQTHKLLNIL